MRKKIHAPLVALAVALTVAVFVGSRTERPAVASPAANYIVSSLPESDAVIFIDAQRLLADTIPGVLANDPALLARVNDRIDKFKEKTDVDLRLFDSIAVGVRFVAPSKNEEFKFVALAQGRFDANAVLNAVLIAAKRDGGLQPQERQYDGRTVFILTPGRLEEKKPEDKQAETAEAPKATGPHVMALAAFDANTLVFGDLESVRAALDISAKRVDDELARLATIKPDAVVGFSGNVPSFLTQQLERETDPIAKNLSAIRQVYGSVSNAGAETETHVTLRTENPDQAREISRAVSALKLLGSFNTKQTSSAQTRSPQDLIKNVTVTSEGNEVFLSLKLAQTDIAPVVRGF
jgi:hypothetical protein